MNHNDIIAEILNDEKLMKLVRSEVLKTPRVNKDNSQGEGSFQNQGLPSETEENLRVKNPPLTKLVKIFFLILSAFGNIAVAAGVIMIHLELTDNPPAINTALLVIVMGAWIYMQLLMFPSLEELKKK